MEYLDNINKLEFNDLDNELRDYAKKMMFQLFKIWAYIS